MSNSGLHVSRPVESGPASVLLVEDDLPIRDSLGEALTEEGFDVSTAGNGAEALERLRSGRRPSVIVLDLMMPVMDGWDFRQQQLGDPALRDIPVVVVSAVGFSGEKIRLQFGDVAVFSKPVAYLDLLVVLRRACQPPVTAPVV